MTSKPKTPYRRYQTFRTSISDEEILDEIDKYQRNNDISNKEFLQAAIYNLILED